MKRNRARQKEKSDERVSQTMQQSPNAFMTGLVLVSTTVIFWGVLPVALVFALALQDGTTITWFRFLIAAIVCTAYQGWKGRLAEFTRLRLKDWLLLLLAAIFLIGDYLLYIYGLTYIDPSAMQVFSQTTPLFMALGGILFFKEKLTRLQGLCFVALFFGLGMFFNSAIANFEFGQTNFIIGAILAVVASIIWAFYAMLQKLLADRLSAMNILLFIYILAVFSLFPMSDLASFATLDGANWAILMFCAFNTLVAYNAFSESLKYWPTTHISSVIAITPLATILASYVGSRLWPETVLFASVNMVGWAGVALTLVAMVVFNFRRKPPVLGQVRPRAARAAGR